MPKWLFWHWLSVRIGTDCLFTNYKLIVLIVVYRELLVVGGISVKEQIEALYRGVCTTSCPALSLYDKQFYK